MCRSKTAEEAACTSKTVKAACRSKTTEATCKSEKPIRHARKPETKRSILREFPFLEDRGNTVNGEAKVVCTWCLVTMRFDRATVKNHAATETHTSKIGRRQRQLGLAAAFLSLAPATPLCTVVTRAASVGIPLFKLRRRPSVSTNRAFLQEGP